MTATENLWRWSDLVLQLVHRTPELSNEARSFELTRDINHDARQHQRFTSALTTHLASDQSLRSLPPTAVGPVLDRVYDELLGISVLGPLWRDPEVTEILVDGWANIRVERFGKIEATTLSFRSEEHGQRVARELAAKVSDRALSAGQPCVTAELPGARVTLMVGRIVKSGLAIAMRKFRPLLGMAALLERNSLTNEMAHFLSDCVRSQANILVSGGTGTGKTTFVNALSEAIPRDERVITIEDAYELSLSVPNWVALQSLVKASADDSVRVDLARLLVESLRMRPDRIIVGEIREAGAASVMLEASNTGHEGTITTIHASSVHRAINFRLANWVRAGSSLDKDLAVSEILNAFQVVVQVERSKITGNRFVSEIGVLDHNLIVDGSAGHVTLWKADAALVDGVEHIKHERAGSVPAGSDLAAKLRAFGIHQWFEPVAETELSRFLSAGSAPGNDVPDLTPPAKPADDQVTPEPAEEPTEPDADNSDGSELAEESTEHAPDSDDITDELADDQVAPEPAEEPTEPDADNSDESELADETSFDIATSVSPGWLGGTDDVMN